MDSAPTAQSNTPHVVTAFVVEPPPENVEIVRGEAILDVTPPLWRSADWSGENVMEKRLVAFRAAWTATPLTIGVYCRGRRLELVVAIPVAGVDLNAIQEHARRVVMSALNVNDG